MEHVLCILAGKVRHEKLHGRPHTVVPAVMLTEGVHNGSQGPLYYPLDELKRDPAAWNGMPLTLGHPIANGQPVSARSADILNEYGLGVVLESKTTDKLGCEAWIDDELADKRDKRILRTLNEGGTIELSTGVFVRAEPAPTANASFQGKAYEAVARDLKPDHLAILLDIKGACSREAGCGLNVNEETRVTNYHLPAPLANEMSHDQIRQELSEALRSKFTQDQPFAWITDVFDAYFIYQVGEELYRQSYRQMADGVLLSSDAPVHVEREVSFIPTDNQSKETDMPMDAKAKATLISGLIANGCGCWGAEDEKVLNGFTDEKLLALQTSNGKHQQLQSLVDNATKGTEVAGKIVVLNATTGQYVVTDKPTPAPTTNTKQVSLQDWLADPSVPSEVKGAFETARNIEARERANVINAMTAHVSDPTTKKMLVDNLATKPLAELQTLQLLTANQIQQQPRDPVYNWLGQVGGGNGQMVDNTDKDDILPIPVANFGAKGQADNDAEDLL